MNNGEKLALEIIQLSVSGTWKDAKEEWQLADVYYEEKPEECLCGHYPINEICVIKNYRNQKTTIVGNSCVKKFLKLSSGGYFQAFRRVKNDNTKSLNDVMINHAHKQKWINDWEKKFYFDIYKKRNLSDKQLLIKTEINTKVLAKFNKS